MALRSSDLEGYTVDDDSSFTGSPEAARVRGRFEATERDIMNLIEKADSPKDKAYLLILFKIHSSLVENTIATLNNAKETAAQGKGLTAHSSKEELMFAQLRGGWKATVAMIGVVGVLFGVIQWLAWQVMSSYVQSMTTNTAQMTSNTARIFELEKELYLLRGGNAPHPPTTLVPVPPAARK